MPYEPPPEALRCYQSYDQTLEHLLEITDIETVTDALKALLRRLTAEERPQGELEVEARRRLTEKGIPIYAQVRGVVDAEIHRMRTGSDPIEKPDRKDLFA